MLLTLFELTMVRSMRMTSLPIFIRVSIIFPGSLRYCNTLDNKWHLALYLEHSHQSSQKTSNICPEYVFSLPRQNVSAPLHSMKNSGDSLRTADSQIAASQGTTKIQYF